jgi:hypothetical protein
MTENAMNVAAATMSAIAAIAALIVAWLTLRQSQRAAEFSQKQIARSLDDSFQARLDPMYGGLRLALGHIEDGVPKQIRHILIPFFVLYSDAFGAHRDGLMDERDWAGLSQELAYWSQKPVARRAWQAFRQQTWTHGFAEHVDAVLVGPPAYPDLQELQAAEPELRWAAD